MKNINFREHAGTMYSVVNNNYKRDVRVIGITTISFKLSHTGLQAKLEYFVPDLRRQFSEKRLKTKFIAHA